MDKQDKKNTERVTIDASHTPAPKPQINFIQRWHNVGYGIGTTLRRAISHLGHENQRAQFATEKKIKQFNSHATAAMITYDSGADGHYLREHNQQKALLSIIQQLTKRVGFVNGGTSKANFGTRLPFKQLFE